MIGKFRSGLSKLAAIGAVKRRGIGALESYGGSLQGSGYVIHKSGPDKGKKTKFKIDGKPVAKT
ncbi:MAG TPA: hypothetical protein PKH39_18545 [Woeseiaceae bacterium]|nr:hypothetical protein [Woeseiaceae bacterium]